MAKQAKRHMGLQIPATQTINTTELKAVDSAGITLKDSGGNTYATVTGAGIGLTQGFPYNHQITGTITTNGSGAATISLVGWGWANYDSFRRLHLFMVGLHYTSSGELAGYLGGMSASANVFGSLVSSKITFATDANIGSRFLTIQGLAANTSYDYRIRAVAVQSDYISWGA